jgi:hypothetical protein
MIYLFWFLVFIFGIFVLSSMYNLGRAQGREEAYMEKSIEVIRYNNKDVVLINEAYFTMEQAQQIAETLKKKNPVVYKPKKQ